MKLAIVAVTARGALLGLKAAELLREKGHNTQVYSIPQIVMDGVMPLEGTLGSAMGGLFSQYRGLVMIMAMGIVVRTIAPYIRDKRKDPAVVALDEGGNFAVSVLSGHVGGANDLADILAKGLGAAAVITTATDVQGAPAVDVLARDYCLDPDPPEMVKKINASLARGEKVHIYSEYDIPIEDSEFIEVKPWRLLEVRTGLNVLVTGRNNISASEGDLVLRPRNLVAGVGCKKGTGSESIILEIRSALEAAGKNVLCLRALATINDKITEEGLVEAAMIMGIPLLSFAKEEIDNIIERKDLSRSQFVMSKMGVGGVCEPTALLACRKGKLLVGKRKGRGITVALAEEEYGWWE